MPDINVTPEMKEKIDQFCLFDDIFLSAVFDNNPEPTERMLRIILDRDDITVTGVHTQKRFVNLLYHEVVLDIEAVTDSGDMMDVEVQRDSREAIPRRARYILTMMDSKALDKGIDYSELKDSYVIFITETDVIGMGWPVYRAEWKLTNAANIPFDIGSHIIYVNGAFKAKPGEETDLSKLIHDFHCRRAEDMMIPDLAKAVWTFKNTEGGQIAVCKVIQDMIESAEEAAIIDVTASYVKGLMQAMAWTADEAMDKLSVPVEQRLAVKKRLEETKQ